MSDTRSKHLLSQAHVNFRVVLVVLLLQLSSPNTRGIRAKPIKKVIEGISAPVGRFPYMCSLRRRGSREHVCGGTLIESRWLLTAAHCVERQYVGMSPIVYCGIYEREEHNSSKAFAADRTLVHPNWNGNISDGYDIALIQLDRTSDCPNPDLPTQGTVYMAGSNFVAMGWGVDSSKSLADLLQTANCLTFLPTMICNSEEYWDGQIKDSMICAGTGIQDTAEGDSGGPLLLLDTPQGNYTLGKPSYDLLVGITSFGEDVRHSFTPGVYTSVSYFRDWIDSIVKEKDDCSNDAQKTTESAVVAEESQSTSSNATQVEQNTTQPSPTSDISSAPLKTSGESYSVSPDAFAETSAKASGSLAEVSEEDIDDLDEEFGPCTDITPHMIVNETLALERAREATKTDDSETVEELLCAGLSPESTFDVSYFDRNWTLLHEASRYDAIKATRVLIGCGADIEKSDSRRHRPLHIAARYNSLRVAKLLIDFGADVDGRGLLNGTSLLYAAVGNSLAVAKLLVREGADIESRDTWNRTPLHHASWFNAFEVAKFLIDSGASISSKDYSGNTPLHYSARTGALQVAEVLVDSGADLDAKDNDGQTPLHEAARRNQFDVTEFLVNNGASKKKKDDDGDTPYDVICASTTCTPQEVARLQRLLRV